MLPYASCAVIVMLEGIPSIWLPIELKMKRSRLPAMMSKALLVPDLVGDPPVVLIVVPMLARVSVTMPVQAPFEKEAVVVGVIVPVEAVSAFVPV